MCARIIPLRAPSFGSPIKSLWSLASSKRLAQAQWVLSVPTPCSSCALSSVSDSIGNALGSITSSVAYSPNSAASCVSSICDFAVSIALQECFRGNEASPGIVPCRQYSCNMSPDSRKVMNMRDRRWKRHTLRRQPCRQCL